MTFEELMDQDYESLVSLMGVLARGTASQA